MIKSISYRNWQIMSKQFAVLPSRWWLFLLCAHEFKIIRLNGNFITNNIFLYVWCMCLKCIRANWSASIIALFYSQLPSVCDGMMKCDFYFSLENCYNGFVWRVCAAGCRGLNCITLNHCAVIFFINTYALYTKCLPYDSKLK